MKVKEFGTRGYATLAPHLGSANGMGVPTLPSLCITRKLVCTYFCEMIKKSQQPCILTKTAHYLKYLDQFLNGFACNLQKGAHFCETIKTRQQPYVLTKIAHYPKYLDQFLINLLTSFRTGSCFCEMIETRGGNSVFQLNLHIPLTLRQLIGCKQAQRVQVHLKG